MCGILYTNNPSITKERFLRALELMRHRGPDAPLCYAAHHESQLGHNRLKIIDLDERSNQPFYSSDGRHVIIFNGEIYNYKELIQKHNLRMRTTGDTEVLLELYAKQGPKMLSELNGMFAFIIVDTQTSQFFAVRDRLGVKPLYFSRRGETVTFASEIASLIELSGSVQFDPAGLRQYRKLRTFFNHRTLYAGIEMFPAGHYMEDGKIQRYWQLPEGPQEPPSDEELRSLIESAVQYRCISDVPVGSYLSGGLDSTIIAGLASKPHTWTVGFKDCNEFEWGQMAAQKFNGVHSEVIIEKEEFVSLASFMIKKRREPLSVPNEVLLYKMTQEVKKHNTVILSGEGADELFFGYDRIFRWAANSSWNLEDFTKLYAYGSHEDLEIVEEAMAPFLNRKKAIDIVAAFFQTAHLHGLLMRLDYSTMLCSVEARTPFIDYRLVERMAGIPFEYRMSGGVVKAPLKRIFRDLIPAAILERLKVGFPVNLSEIPLGVSGETPMDQWLEFNLSQLAGIPLNIKDIL